MSRNKTHFLILLTYLFSGALSAATLNLPFDVEPGLNNLTWELGNDGGSDGTAFTGSCDGTLPGFNISEATSADGSTEAFDRAWMLYVDGNIFVAPNDVDLTGEIFTAGSVVMSGLNVSIEIRFPDALQAARILALFENPTNVDITITVEIPINLGSNTDTVIERTSSGDEIFTTADRWIITSANTNTEAINTTVFYGVGDLILIPLSVVEIVCNDDNTQPEGVGLTFSVTVPANTTRSLMFFAGLGDIQGTNNTVSGAISNAAMFNSNGNIDTRLLAGLSNSEKLEILNWDFFTASANDGISAADDDTNFVDDFFGCSLGNNRSKDPTLLLLVLLALAGLGRNRLSR